MALTTCPECGQMVSSTAKVCPHCGYDLSTEITIADPENFLGADDYKKMTENQQAGNGQYRDQQMAPSRLNNRKNTSEDEDNYQGKNINKSSNKNNYTGAVNTENGKKSKSRPIIRRKTKTKTKYKKKRKSGLFSSSGKSSWDAGYRKQRNRQSRDDRRDGRGLGCLFHLIIWVIIIVLLFFGIRRYGSTIVSYAKEFINNHKTTEESSEPGNTVEGSQTGGNSSAGEDSDANTGEDGNLTGTTDGSTNGQNNSDDGADTGNGIGESSHLLDEVK
jgi:hypothetical protein